MINNTSSKSYYTTSFDTWPGSTIQCGSSLGSLTLPEFLQSSPKQTKMIVVPIRALIKPTDDIEKVDERTLLSNFRCKFNEGGRYVLVPDYRQNAVFSVIDLDNGNSQKSDELPPYRLPIYDEPSRYWRDPNEYDRRWFEIYYSELDKSGVKID